MMAQSFLYFGYGSNLLRQRLQLRNPTAQFVSVGELKGYRLGFTNFDGDTALTRWKGGAATIMPSTGNSVWGCIWRLSIQDLPSLDRQELFYEPIDIQVNSPDGNTHSCRSYIAPPPSEDCTFDARPSPMYMDVIIRGAHQNNLPSDYIKSLEAIKTNGFSGEVPIYQEVLKLIS